MTLGCVKVIVKANLYTGNEQKVAGGLRCGTSKVGLAGVQEVLTQVTDCHFLNASLQESVR